MKKIALIIIIFAALGAIISSCGRKDPMIGKPANLHGGVARTNSFEIYGNFYQTIPVIHSPRSEDSSGAIGSPLVVSADMVAIPTVEGSIILLEFDRVSWIARLDQGELVAAGMAADAEKNIYAVSSAGKLYSFDNNGLFRWFVDISDTVNQFEIYSDLLALDDGILCATSSGLLAKISLDGKVIWQKKFGGAITSTFAVDDKGNIAVPVTQNDYSKTDTLFFLDSRGEEIWKKTFDGARLIETPALSNGKIFISAISDLLGNRLSAVYALNSKGEEIWKKELTVVPRTISVSNDAKVYVTGYNPGIGENVSGVFCFDTDGEMLWKIYFEAAIVAPVLISSKSLAVIAITTRRVPALYFLDLAGNVIQTMSMHELPDVIMKPTVNVDRNIIFAGVDKFLLLVIDESFFYKIIPW